MKVLLFDIDATLLLSGQAGTRALNRTFEELYGIQGALDNIRPDGKTDPLIFREIFRNRLPGVEPDAEFSRAGERYLGYLEEELNRSPGFRLMPGVKELLERLSQQPGVVLGLATGNLERGAWLKLRRGGLESYFHFGGYGSDAENRTDLIRIAVERARAHVGERIATEKFLVIGDTRRDIQHARAAGVRTVAVATGRESEEELALHEPDYLFKDLSLTDRVLDVLAGPNRDPSR